ALAIPGSPSGWISINSVFGNIAPGDDYQFAINLDAMNYIPGDTLEADIHYTSVPDVGEQNVHVTMTVGTEEWGLIEGTVLLGGSVPYNNGDVTEVEVTAGPYSASPDSTGNYFIEVYPGNYDVTAALYGYTQQIIPDITVIEGGTVSNLDFIMSTINGRLMGIVTDELTGEPIENATVSVLGTDFEVMTASDGTYEIFIEAGTYSVMVEYPGYMTQSFNDVVVIGEADTQLDFELLQPQTTCIFTVELWDDYGDGWTGCTLTILVDGNVVLDNITLASGYGPEAFDFETGSGSEVSCVFTAGGWPYECSYYVYDNDGTEIFADGVGGVEPAGGTFISFCGYVYGDLEGYLTDCITSDPIENGDISLGSGLYFTTTGSDGYFIIEDIMVGEWELSYSAPGYCLPQEVVMVTILEGQTTTIDNLCLYSAQFEVDPDSFYVSLEPNSTTTELITIDNPGFCDVDFDVYVEYYTEGLFEIQFQWGLVLATKEDWLQIYPITGILSSGATEEILIVFNSTDLLPGVYEADIIFNTEPDTSPNSVHLIFAVQGLEAPINLSCAYDCTDICLYWDMPGGSNPDYFNIYRDGMLIDTTTGSGFCDTLITPEIEYSYYITAVYDGEESQPTPDVPENLEPTDPGCTHYENGYFIYWDQPDGCLASEGYNLYCNGVLLETLPNTDLSYFDPNINPGFFEYSISSVYYFGESEPVIAFCITGIEKNIKDRIAIYPNPVKSWLVIRSDAQLKFVEIYNNIGIEVQDQELSGTESLINISNCNPGIYFLKITTSDSDVFIRKIVVE
ncbi:MAG: carboxypeptidase regulatory-like domain-containing protein, partial [Bacteroidales bacterium]|nr:carboxypeptidase regulatory-like domain-containing protein [Bacteroidales bacterium]